MAAKDRMAWNGSRPLTALGPGLAAAHPQAVVAYRADATPVTGAELADRVGTFADLLPTDPGRVLVRLPNSLDGVAAVLAVWQRGGSAVLVSPMVPPAEVERRILQTGAGVLLDVGAGSPRLRSLTSAGRAAPLDDEAAVVFTSGTTGHPKGAVLGHAGLAASLRSIGEAIGHPDGRPPAEPPRSPTPIFMPLAHVGGLIGSLGALYQGKPLLVLDRFRAADVFDLVERFDLRLLRLAPTMLFDLARWPEERDLGRVRSVSVGSAPLSEQVRSAFEDRYGAVVLQSYGLTELAGAVAFERLEDARAGLRRPGTVGRLAPGVQVRIVDDAGVDVALGETGQILAAGPSRLLALIDPDGGVHEPGGWIATGDLGALDADGFLGLLGRRDDTILCGGFNIYPAVVERALNAVPGIVDSAVAGLPDERLGQIPVAAVVTEDGAVDAAAVQTALRLTLAPYELPRRITPVAAVPMTDGNKPDRAAIIDLFAGDGAGPGAVPVGAASIAEEGG